MINPTGSLLSYSNGSYQIDIPSGVDVNSYVIQVEDQRGIIVVASSFSTYTCNLAWISWNGTVAPTQHYVDNNSSDVDSSPNIGTHSNFTAMQQGPDGIMDTLTEGITTPAVPETWVSPSNMKEADGPTKLMLTITTRLRKPSQTQLRKKESGAIP